MRTENELRTAMADAGYDQYFCDDIAYLVAEALGIRKPSESEDWDGTEYGLANEILCDMVAAGMADFGC